MCGRFRLSVDPEDLAEQFQLHLPPRLAPRYNIAPTQPVLAIRQRDVRGGREAVLLHWGLIPSWAKDPAIGSRMINARGETIAEKPSFRNAFRRRRCLIPADGFYEWRKMEGNKQPYHIRREDGRAFAFAGLWEHWMAPDGSEIDSCAIVTTAANGFMRSVHERMPVILQHTEFDTWLSRDEASPAELLELVRQREWEGFVTYPVSRYVNAPQNEGPRCAEPLGEAAGAP